MSKHFGYSGGSIVSPQVSKMSSASKINKSLDVKNYYSRKLPPILVPRGNDSLILKIDPGDKVIKNLPKINNLYHSKLKGGDIKSTNSNKPLTTRNPRPLNLKTFGILGLVGSLMGANGEETPQIAASTKIFVSSTDSTHFESRVKTAQTSISNLLVNSMLSSNATSQNVVDLTVQNISAKDNLTIDIDIDQTVQILNTSKLTIQIVKDIVSNMAKDILDEVISSLDSDQLAALTTDSNVNNSTNLVDSLAKIISGVRSNTQPAANIKNIVNADVVSNYTTVRDTFVTKTLQNFNYVDLLNRVISTTGNFIYVNFNRVVASDVNYRFKTSQVAGIKSIVSSELNLLSSLFDKLESTNELKFAKNVKNNLKTNVENTTRVVNTSEQVTGWVGSLSWPLAAAVGGIGVVAAVLVFNSGGGGLGKKNNFTRLVSSVKNGAITADGAGKNTSTGSDNAGAFELC